MIAIFLCLIVEYSLNFFWCMSKSPMPNYLFTKNRQGLLIFFKRFQRIQAITFLTRPNQVLWLQVCRTQEYGRNVSEQCKSQESRLTGNKLQLKCGMLSTCFSSKPFEIWTFLVPEMGIVSPFGMVTVIPSLFYLTYLNQFLYVVICSLSPESIIHEFFLYLSYLFEGYKTSYLPY